MEKVRFFYVFSKEVIELCCDSTMQAMDVSTSQPLIKIALCAAAAGGSGGAAWDLLIASSTFPKRFAQNSELEVDLSQIQLMVNLEIRKRRRSRVVK